jgi:predicted transcriptional regulator
VSDKDIKALIDEIAAVKKLLILQLLGNGFRQKEIAQMLGVSEATMSRMLPKGISAAASKSSAKESAEPMKGK